MHPTTSPTLVQPAARPIGRASGFSGQDSLPAPGALATGPIGTAVQSAPAAPLERAPAAPAEPRSLVLVGRAAQLLDQARTLDDIALVIDLAAQAKLWARQAHLGLEAQNQAAQIRFEAEAKGGTLLAEMAARGERHPHGRTSEVAAGNFTGQTLAELGVDRSEAHDWAAVAAIPAEIRAAYVADATAQRGEASRAGLLRYFERTRVPDPRVDEVPPAPTEADLYVKPGELWLLGSHRLLCGDATNPDDVARLLDGAEPRLLATDPPYGVQLDQTWRDDVYNTAGRLGAKAYPAAKPYMMRDAADGQADETHASAGAHRRTAGHRNITISGDTRADWSEAFALVPSLQVGYIWYASAHTLEVLQGLLAIGFELVQQIIWDKGKFAMSRQWYHWEHEPCFVVRKPGVPNLFIGKDHTQSTIWRAPSPKQLGSGSHEEKQDHPTQKAILLFEIPIANHLRPGEAVYDPFVGSGTTIIAAEQLGRRCYAMEIDPVYVQLAKERWERLTGAKAVRG